MFLMCLCSVQISVILNLRLFSQRSSSGGWVEAEVEVGGFPQILFPPSLPSSVPSSFDYEDYLDAHTQRTTSPLLPDSLGLLWRRCSFLRLSPELHWLLSIRDRLCHFTRGSCCCCCCCSPSTNTHTDTTETKKKLKA